MDAIGICFIDNCSMALMTLMRCIQCGEYHQGECDKSIRLAFLMDCCLDTLDEYLGLPPEPGSRRWMIERGEYPKDKYPSGELEEISKL